MKDDEVAIIAHNEVSIIKLDGEDTTTIHQTENNGLGTSKNFPQFNHHPSGSFFLSPPQSQKKDQNVS